MESFDPTTGTLTGLDRSGKLEVLKHGPTTLHLMIGDPNLIPTDPCRLVAQAWNLSVYEQLSIAFYNQLLTDSATHGCRFEYIRSDTADASGAYPLVGMRPAK